MLRTTRQLSMARAPFARCLSSAFEAVPAQASCMIIAARAPASETPAPEDGFRLLFLKRSATMRFQPNFHAFPGGKVDPTDALLAQALREAAFPTLDASAAVDRSANWHADIDARAIFLRDRAPSLDAPLGPDAMLITRACRPPFSNRAELPVLGDLPAARAPRPAPATRTTVLLPGDADYPRHLAALLAAQGPDARAPAPDAVPVAAATPGAAPRRRRLVRFDLDEEDPPGAEAPFLLLR
ncbi:hypothetical protein H696_01372 [Fonticula alba]|uniref:Nudix hydrolase domain-containing protein n=1 Tax=Fonticula alba TaxID=691883 RepID=A0A058ZDH4_FONAL|nr:hypothetical protein H696_01372 [Fonticula alba]KCV71963.1 hypothetical protein H696_01372 [Fonticula alba]|eukprot:XP_009493541.1 hypothetical protein H696_01372 [Fonticula alba]